MMLKVVTFCTLGSRKKITAWMAYSRKYTGARPIRSDIQAQKTRPAPLKMEIRPTMPAAASGVILTICCAIGEAWLMIMIPAETFRNSMNHSSQNCQVLIAWVTVKSILVALFCTADFAVQPGSTHPAGGLA